MACTVIISFTALSAAVTVVFAFIIFYKYAYAFLNAANSRTDSLKKVAGYNAENNSKNNYDTENNADYNSCNLTAAHTFFRLIRHIVVRNICKLLTCVTVIYRHTVWRCRCTRIANRLRIIICIKVIWLCVSIICTKIVWLCVKIICAEIVWLCVKIICAKVVWLWIVVSNILLCRFGIIIVCCKIIRLWRLCLSFLLFYRLFDRSGCAAACAKLTCDFISAIRTFHLLYLSLK